MWRKIMFWDNARDSGFIQRLKNLAILRLPLTNSERDSVFRTRLFQIMLAGGLLAILLIAVFPPSG